VSSATLRQRRWQSLVFETKATAKGYAFPPEFSHTGGAGSNSSSFFHHKRQKGATFEAPETTGEIAMCYVPAGTLLVLLAVFFFAVIESWFKQRDGRKILARKLANLCSSPARAADHAREGISERSARSF
jgi:hypothetical protein